MESILDNQCLHNKIIHVNDCSIDMKFLLVFFSCIMESRKAEKTVFWELFLDHTTALFFFQSNHMSRICRLNKEL